MKYQKWSSRKSLEEKGIVVAADLTQEWILPWWWHHYRQHNTHPIAFIDLGLSEEAKKWCRERGALIRLPLPDIYVAERQQIDPSLIKHWEKAYSAQFWENRSGWFKKPLACLLSPFHRSIWIDLDCEVRGPLQDLFHLSDHGIALALEQNETGYNSGVIVFQRGISIMETWARKVFEWNHLYPGDQDVLTKIIQDEQLSVAELPPIYNWSRRREENPNALIVHWHGRYGKSVIAHQLMKLNLE